MENSIYCIENICCCISYLFVFLLFIFHLLKHLFQDKFPIDADVLNQYTDSDFYLHHIHPDKHFDWGVSGDSLSNLELYVLIISWNGINQKGTLQFNKRVSVFLHSY